MVTTTVACQGCLSRLYPIYKEILVIQANYTPRYIVYLAQRTMDQRSNVRCDQPLVLKETNRMLSKLKEYKTTVHSLHHYYMNVSMYSLKE